MSWSAITALPAIESFAVVQPHVIELVEERFNQSAVSLQDRVESSFDDLDRKHPALATLISAAIANIHDETAQSLGYFLTVAVWEFFYRAFGERLATVDADAVRVVQEALDVDQEWRRTHAIEPLESDDVIALQQPHVMQFVRAQLDSTLAPQDDDDGDEVAIDCVDTVYEMILVVVMALSRAVMAPPGLAKTKRLLS